jgi:hypothetical protein
MLRMSPGVVTDFVMENPLSLCFGAHCWFNSLSSTTNERE